MKYRPNCLYIGVALQISGLVMFALIWIFEAIRRRDLVKAGHPVYCPVSETIPECLPDETAFEEIESETGNVEISAEETAKEEAVSGEATENDSSEKGE